MSGSCLNFKPQRFAISAAVDHKSVAPRENKDGTDNGSEKVDMQKMVKVCDKLIEVFMVDKPTPADWRRLLAFSKEWENIRPHFYKRCQDRADSEDNPEMKHKIHRLARKLKEVKTLKSSLGIVHVASLGPVLSVSCLVLVSSIIQFFPLRVSVIYVI